MRKQFSKIAFLATLGFALAFTLSCTSDDGDNILNSTSSSSSKLSSSSGSLTGTSGNIVDSRDNKSYKWVKIGEQTWMAENLNYNANGSKCYAEGVSGVSADSIAKNCAKYGKLYDWPTAMVLPTSCIDSECASQISAKHKGVCPSGWHIPSGVDRNMLIEFVEGASGTRAGIKLKATSGWNNTYVGKSGNGTDDYGFSALPGGYRNSDGDFGTVGSIGAWWTSWEWNSNSGKANQWYMINSDELVGYNFQDKSRLYSVRCLQD